MRFRFATVAASAALLVLTGVTTAADLLAAVPEQRPTYVARSVAGLLEPQPEAERAGDDWTCAGWTVSPGGRLSGDGDDLDALRALCAAAWSGGGTTVTADGQAATATVQRLGL